MNYEEKILRLLRSNARTKISEISQQLKIPRTRVTTKLRDLKLTCIKKFVSLIYFDKLGYKERVVFFIRSPTLSLTNFNPVNNLCKLRGKHNWMIECYFKNNEETATYMESLEKYKPKIYNIVEEISHEEVYT